VQQLGDLPAVLAAHAEARASELARDQVGRARSRRATEAETTRDRRWAQHGHRRPGSLEPLPAPNLL
jgi:hypothetical protein